MSTFFGLNIAQQGLYTAQAGLNVTGHNISNANTRGYSRQVINQQASPALPSYMSTGMYGTGSQVISVDQVRNQYYDIKYWETNKVHGEYSIKSTYLAHMEAIFAEPSDYGFTAYFDGLFEQMMLLSTNPTDMVYRQTFIESASGFTGYFNSVDAQLRAQQQELNMMVKAKVDEINSLAEQIASLNHQIRTLEFNGQVANDLRDQRANLLDDLSAIIDIEVEEISEGHNNNRLVVSVNGQTLIDGTDVNKLNIVPRDGLANPEDEPGMYDIYWSNGQPLDVYSGNLSGELIGYIHLRDGNNGENYTGSVTNVDGNQITIAGNRNDLPPSGTIKLDNKTFEYTSYTYNPVTGELTFELTEEVPNNITAGSKAEIGNSCNYKGIPYYIQQLNEFVRTFARAMNEVHKQGENLNGETGQVLFSYDGYDGTIELDEDDYFSYNSITAKNFSLDQGIIDDPKKIATTSDITNGRDDNDIINALVALKDDVNMFDKGTPSSFMGALISELAISAKQADDFSRSQANMLTQVQNQRLSVSGVDLNEETVNLLQYQHAYNLAAKVVSVMDEILNVTVNQLGA